MRLASRLETTLGLAAVSALLVTVCVLPWIHGSAIPLARLILQWGACSAGALSLLSGLLSRRNAGVPSIAYPLGILICVGVVQLLPIHAPMIGQMNHALLEEMRHDLPKVDTTIRTARTGSPADTRMIVAQGMALLLLAITAHDQIRSLRSIRLTLAVFMFNALTFSLLAFIQMFKNELFLIRLDWWTGMGKPFGTFVNANNAAGWLCTGLASAVGFLILQFRGDDSCPLRQYDTPWRLFTRYLADLTALKIVTLCSVVVIACAVVATRSRGAMITTGLSLLLIGVVRLRMRHLLGTSIILFVTAAGLCTFLLFLNLDDAVTAELGTLDDPVSALTPRTLHWKDSLQAVWDFPLLGAGLGAYRYVTLPYQTQNAGVWFQHADNEYVELAIEAGGVGLAMFVLIGALIFFPSLAVLRNSIVKGSTPAQEAVASVLVIAVFSQGLCSLFDYGSVLPATASLFVVLASMGASTGTVSPHRKRREKHPTKLVMHLMLLTSAGVFIPDLAAAQECYLVSIVAGRATDGTVTNESLEERANILSKARKIAETRVDDPNVNEVISKLSNDLLRAEFIRGLPELDRVENLKRVWPYTSSIAVVRRNTAKDLGNNLARHLQTVLVARVMDSELITHCQYVMRHQPLPTVILRRAARWAAAAGLQPDASNLPVMSRFCEPANSQLGLQFAEIAIRQGAAGTAQNICTQILRTDPAIRGFILRIYASSGLFDAGFSEFGPSTYSEAVMAARGQSDPALIEKLFAQANSFWKEPIDVPSTEDQLCRNEHLASSKQYISQRNWLKRCIEWSPNNARLHRELALLLVRLGQPDEALVEWYEVLRIEPHNTYAKRQAKRTKATISRQKESNH